MGDYREPAGDGSPESDSSDSELVPKASPKPGDCIRKLSPVDRSTLEMVLRRVESVIGENRLGILTEARIRERFLLLDSQLVTEYLIAFLGAFHRELELTSPESLTPPIDEAISAIMVEAESEEIGARLHEDCYSEDHVFAMQSMGVESALVTRATSRFNSLPERVRETFFAACLEGETLESCKDRGLGTREKIGDAIYFAFTALLTIEKLDRVRRKKDPER